ncbi:MAG: heavy-metal-associated domain-containing protein [Chromatiales bacterium]|jgi:copper chaperone|nr:heavy-metal-associated domain-containing protein [Chromatiales bacterium]MDX9767381.1 heavy-metal-associated domain-containing protein [Ectothiorhodospiraceae bacterium]
MEFSIEVDNIKCGGCANSIKKGLAEDARVQGVEVDVENGRVTVNAADDIRAEIARRLAGLGYPERGSVSGTDAFKAKAKSFVSCAVGRMGGQD